MDRLPEFQGELAAPESYAPEQDVASANDVSLDFAVPPDDPRQVVEAIRHGYRAERFSMDQPPLGTFSAIYNYLSRIKATNRELYLQLSLQLGQEGMVDSLAYVIGPFFSSKTTTSETLRKVNSDANYPVATAFMEDVLAIRAMGFPDASTKAALYEPGHYVQKVEQPVYVLAPQSPPEQTPPPPATWRQRSVEPALHLRRWQEPSRISSDGLALYVNSSKYTTEKLSTDQENELGKDIQAGALAQEKLDEKAYDATEKTALEQQVALGEQAKTRLIESRLDLVIAVTNNYHHPQASRLDLIQEGNLGLIEAAKRFDPAKGAFSSYAKSWIKKYILQSIVEVYPTIRIPDSHGRAIGKMQAYIDTFAAEHRRNPTREEIMEATGIKSGQFTSAWETAMYASLFSADALASNANDQNLTLSDITVDRNSLGPEMVTIHTEDPLLNMIHEAIAAADDPNLGMILVLHHGLDLGPTVLSPEFIAKHNIEPGKRYAMETVAPMLNISRATAWRRNDKVIALLREKIRESPELADLFFGN
jgi:RNA polymerase sigma factor (sigma-70 family)